MQIEADFKNIQKRNKLLRSFLSEEEGRYGGYHKWYDSLRLFRKFVRDRFTKYMTPMGTYRIRRVDNENMFIDHHVISYLSPLFFKRIGWGGALLSPSEQLIQLERCFKHFGTRFIYVPLPNKGTIYPGLFGFENAAKLPVNPQWRRYIKELAEADIEIVDAEPFLRGADYGKEKRLFHIHDHNISGYGAYVLGRVIAEYIKNTSFYEPQEAYSRYIYMKGADINNKSDGMLYMALKRVGKEITIPYYSDDKDASIGIFGDCNLQSGWEFGASVSANLAYELGMPVDYVGRRLVFTNYDRLDVETFRHLIQKEIVIYLAFSSASYVRSTQCAITKLGRIFSWNTLDVRRLMR